jgi:hypothetical protein
MPSNINPYNIDGTFPVAGQDNSSQGFRDNFTNIKNNLTFAQNEISDLQSKAITTSALTGQTLTNDMAGTKITRPQLNAWTQSLRDLGSVNGNALLDFNQANFQKITTAGPVILSFNNWPTTTGSGSLGYGLMRVWINVTDLSHTITLDPSVTVGVNDIAGYNPVTHAITFDAIGNYIFDFSSLDSGASYLIFDVTRNRATFRDPSFYLNNNINPTILVGYNNWTALDFVKHLEPGQDVISSFGSYNSVSVGNLSLGNISYSMLDTGGLAGYSVSSARGNLAIGSVLPAQNKDLLGYFNAITFTGNGTANVFQQVASVDFFATGSNVQYGLGGNIAFFTADDGGSGPNYIKQAVGIENDQSAKFFGNVTITGNLNVIGATTIAANATVTLANVSNIGDVSLTTLSNGQVLTYNTNTHKWYNSSVAAISQLANLGDVSVSSVAQGDYVRYDSTLSKWINAPFAGTQVNYTVTIGDDGSTSHNVFKLNGTPIKTNLGVTTPINFKVGGLYKFDISDASNQYLGLGFSTTPDTSDPASVTPYTTNVTRVGTAGSSGAYVTINITDTTASPLYLYGIETGVPDGSLLGGAVPNYIYETNSGEQTVVGNLTIGNGSHASNVSVYGSLSTINYVTAGLGIQNTAIGTVARSQAYFTNTYTGGLQAQAIGNVTPGSATFTTVTMNGNLFVSGSYIPSAINSSGAAGQIAYDSTHIYVCVATNSWLRANLATW